MTNWKPKPTSLPKKPIGQPFQSPVAKNALKNSLKKLAKGK